MSIMTRRSFLKLALLSLAAGAISACEPRRGILTIAPGSPISTTRVIPSFTPMPSTGTNTPASPPLSVPAARPTLSPTPNPTSTLTPTETLQPTQVVLPDPLYELTLEQKQRLDNAARQYIAETEPEAIEVSQKMGYLTLGGHPSNVCGPLAAAILRDAGLINRYVDLHDYWLLDPRQRVDSLVLQETFPEDLFWHYRFEESVAAFDYRVFPLLPGDFLYLYAGPSGTYEHMFTVTRVDQAGRAYTVTNLNTEQGYIIQEVLLYDPARPGVGQMYEWTDRKNRRLGNTGFGGFELWRFKPPLLDATPAQKILADKIDAVVNKLGGQWHILFESLESGILYDRLSRIRIQVASVIKIPIAMLFLQNWQRGGQTLSALSVQGIDGRSYEQLLHAMIVKSEEDATESVLKSIAQSRLDVAKSLQDWGLKHTDIINRKSTVHELGFLFKGLYRGSFLPANLNSYLLDLMAVYTPEDDTRLGVLRQVLPPGYPIFNKRGSLTEEQLIVADMAIFPAPTPLGDQVFLAGIFAYQGEQHTSYRELEQGFDEIARLFWEATQQ